MPTVEEMMGLCSKARYFNANSVGDGIFLTIATYQVDSMKAKASADAEDKPVLYFEEDPRGWVLNLSNLSILKAMFGSDMDGWIGKRLTLYNDTRIKTKQHSGGFRVGGIRVKSSPDIATSFSIEVGKTSYRSADKYTIQKVSVVDPLTEALAEHGLAVEQYDVWALANSRPLFADTPPDIRATAGNWVQRGGHGAILRANTAPVTGEE